MKHFGNFHLFTLYHSYCYWLLLYLTTTCIGVHISPSFIFFFSIKSSYIFENEILVAVNALLFNGFLTVLQTLLHFELAPQPAALHPRIE
jgi:hypothetical protein